MEDFIPDREGEGHCQWDPWKELSPQPLDIGSIQSRVPHSILSNIYVVTFYFEIIMDLQKIEKKKMVQRDPVYLSASSSQK